MDHDEYCTGLEYLAASLDKQLAIRALHNGATGKKKAFLKRLVRRANNRIDDVFNSQNGPVKVGP